MLFFPFLQVAHNNYMFDALVLQKNIRRNGLRLPVRVYFSDTLELMKHVKLRGKSTCERC